MADHDALYHRLFSHPVMVEQLLREFVPEAAGLDLARMERVAAKFHSRNGQRREGDVIWRLPAPDGTDVYLYLLMEFQSRTDWWMAVRAQVYEGLLWQQLIAEKTLKPGDRPPVLLLVLYNGEPRWTAPTAVADLIALPAESPLWPWQPQIRYHLLDMGAFRSDDLIGRETLAALLFRLEQRQEMDTLASLIDEVICWFRQHPGYDDLKTLFAELVRQSMIGVGSAVPISDDLVEMRTMLATLGEYWKQQWKAEGLAEGKAEGLAEGKAEGKAIARAEMLIYWIEKRFGPQSADFHDRILAADAALVEAWLYRVMEAPSLDALFDKAN